MESRLEDWTGWKRELRMARFIFRTDPLKTKMDSRFRGNDVIRKII